MRVENTGEVPVRVTADPRLLSFDVTPPEQTDPKSGKTIKPKDLRCVLPPDARPTTDEGQELVVPAKRSWSFTFDPLYYCFGPRERAALTSGATITPHFGFPLPALKTKGKVAAPAAPFVANPVGAAVGKVAPAKDIVAAAFALTESPVALPETAKPDDANGVEPPVSVGTAESLDAMRGVDLGATVTLTNRSDRAVSLYFRPSTLVFTVNGPAGSVRCGAPQAATPIRDLFSTVGPKQKSSVSLLLSLVCPSDTFDEPGVYRVTAKVDTTTASGREFGLRSWDGVATAKTPMLLRVRNARRARPARPALD